MKTIISNVEEFNSELCSIYFDRIIPIKLELYFKGNRVSWDQGESIPEWVVLATQRLVKQGRIDPNDILIHEEYVSPLEEEFTIIKHDITINTQGEFSEPFGSEFPLCGRLLESKQIETPE